MNKHTLPKNIFSLLRSSKAFSLMEILVVLFIIAFVFTFVAQRFSRKEQKITSTFDRLIRLNRRLATLSRLHDNTYRLAIQLNDEGPEQYWVEKRQAGQKDIDLSYPADAQVEEEEEEEPNEEEREFVLDDSFYSEPKVISPFLSITKVESSVWKEDKTEGVVYIYYYPKGLAQETAIQFLRPDNQGRWTLYLDPATRNLHLLKKEKSLAGKGEIE